MQNNVSQQDDFYFDKNGLMVFTEKFLLKRGSCCGNGCKHCPYNYENVPEGLRKKLLEVRDNENSKK